MLKKTSKQSSTSLDNEKLNQIEQAIKMMDSVIYDIDSKLKKQQDLVKNILEIQNQAILSLIETLEENGMAGLRSNVDRKVTNKKIESMKNKIDILLKSGILKEATEVQAGSFIVCREIDEANNVVINPRVQFAISNLGSDSQQKFINKKVGDTLKIDENEKIIVEILEIYDIVLQQEKS